MNRLLLLSLALIMAGPLAAADKKAKKPKTAAQLEKEKAMKEPFANDYGPETLDAKYLKSLSANAQKGYKMMRARCAECHTTSRPLNSQFVETGGKKKADRMKAADALKKSKPHLFSKENKFVWQIEGAIWQRYVKRMKNKPGCEITGPEAKSIWQFLSEDSRKRKLHQEKKWTAHRGKLIADFKKKHPHRYKELYEVD